MNLKGHINKAGSYIVEAVIALPVFIIAVVMLMSVIPIMGTCENTVYQTVDEIHAESLKSAFRENPLALQINLKHRILDENKNIYSYKINRCLYLYTDKGTDDLILTDYTVTFSEKNPLGAFSSVVFNGAVAGRAYTGTFHKEKPCTRAEFEEERKSQNVYIFPEWGKRYHNKGCRYIHACCELRYLNEEVRKTYKPCSLCEAGSVCAGSPVFCFYRSGEVYHTAGCRTIDKYYIEVEKEDAENKGYTPCLECGGV